MSNLELDRPQVQRRTICSVGPQVDQPTAGIVELTAASVCLDLVGHALRPALVVVGVTAGRWRAASSPPRSGGEGVAATNLVNIGTKSQGDGKGIIPPRTSTNDLRRDACSRLTGVGEAGNVGAHASGSAEIFCEAGKPSRHVSRKAAGTSADVSRRSAVDHGGDCRGSSQGLREGRPEIGLRTTLETERALQTSGVSSNARVEDVSKESGVQGENRIASLDSATRKIGSGGNEHRDSKRNEVGGGVGVDRVRSVRSGVRRTGGRAVDSVGADSPAKVEPVHGVSRGAQHQGTGTGGGVAPSSKEGAPDSDCKCNVENSLGQHAAVAVVRQRSAGDLPDPVVLETASTGQQDRATLQAPFSFNAYRDAFHRHGLSFGDLLALEVLRNGTDAARLILESGFWLAVCEARDKIDTHANVDKVWETVTATENLPQVVAETAFNLVNSPDNERRTITVISNILCWEGKEVAALLIRPTSFRPLSFRRVS